MSLFIILSRLGIVLFFTATFRLMAEPAPPDDRPASNSTFPEIKFMIEEYDFGQASRGDLVKYDFVFTNTGASLLVISNAESSCGCTSVAKWTAQAAPGKTGQIPIALDSAAVSGIVDVFIRVVSNDPRRPEVFLKLKGKIGNGITANPPYALFDLSRASRPDAVKTLDITNTTAQPVTLSDLTINNTNFTAEIKTNAPGWSYQLRVHIASRPDASQQGIITLNTSSKDQPTIVMSVIAIIPPGNAPIR